MCINTSKTWIAISIAVAFLLLSASLMSASSKKPEEFKEGFKALDRKDWVEAVIYLRRALDKFPEGDGQRTRIYGSRFERYYPHYYLGLALYELGCCKAALEKFEESLRDGVIQGKELEYLLTLRDKCQDMLREGVEPEDRRMCSEVIPNEDEGEVNGDRESQSS